MDVLALKFLKNYQVWHHRRLLLGALRDEALKSHSHSTSSGDSSSDELQTKLQTRLRDLAAHEVQFASTVLQDDSKNYHTWSYRQWVLTSAADEVLWASEIPYVEELLREDIRNNSAWHHRFFTVWTAGVREGEEDRREVLKREIK
jgi:protein farnesyltransferase/geranylgeranyltransferase type-1 subunit alpha